MCISHIYIYIYYKIHTMNRCLNYKRFKLFGDVCLRNVIWYRPWHLFGDTTSNTNTKCVSSTYVMSVCVGVTSHKSWYVSWQIMGVVPCSMRFSGHQPLNPFPRWRRPAPPATWSAAGQPVKRLRWGSNRPWGCINLWFNGRDIKSNCSKLLVNTTLNSRG